mmetsp:Transcript_36997/g.97966  ORF Transcript_36997/g.97966 Transcript_36997/m.97966 type:complete len:164 (+) Transcript_36997:826-1317(+)
MSSTERKVRRLQTNQRDLPSVCASLMPRGSSVCWPMKQDHHMQLCPPSNCVGKGPHQRDQSHSIIMHSSLVTGHENRSRLGHVSSLSFKHAQRSGQWHCHHCGFDSSIWQRRNSAVGAELEETLDGMTKGSSVQESYSPLEFSSEQQTQNPRQFLKHGCCPQI